MRGVDMQGNVVPMSSETRGHAIRQRVEDLGRGAQARIATMTGLNRKTIVRAMSGEASVRVYEAIEEALDSLERRIGPVEVDPEEAPEVEVSAPSTSSEKHVVVVRLEGLHSLGIERTVVEASPEDLPAALAAIQKWLQENREG